MPDKTTKSSVGKSIALSALPVAVELGGEIVKRVIEAIANDDPATLKKVTDILPVGHKLRSEITLALEMEKLRKKLEGEQKG